MDKPPVFYDSKRIGTIFYPDTANIAAQAAEAGLKPGTDDKRKVQLLIVDMQVDFCHPSGSLYVPGATGDLQRLIEFIYHQSEHITSITCSLDSHLPYQIFHPAWWMDCEGKHPPAFTSITLTDIINKKWQPLFEPDWSAQYVQNLQEQAKKELTIWPYHCLIGSAGHLLDQELFSAVLWHSLARSSQPVWLTKGSIPQTEHYSIFQPEIPVPDYTQTLQDQNLFQAFKGFEYIFIAGEAASHCILETIEDIVDEYHNQPEMLQRIFVLKDCTSPICHADIDYAAITNQRFAEFSQKGIRFILSTDPMPF